MGSSCDCRWDDKRDISASRKTERETCKRDDKEAGVNRQSFRCEGD